MPGSQEINSLSDYFGTKVFRNHPSFRKNIVWIATLFLGLHLAPPSPPEKHKPNFPADDKVKIAEAFRLADSVQDQIWTNWSKAPFALMLITDNHELLIRHPHATNNFDTLGFDPELGSLVLFRSRLFPKNLLATFPAINGLSTIVVGQSANTSVKSPTAWVVTILHEHFHQYQQSQPDYFAATNALGLSGSDATGMWMLNFPFPYDSASVDSGFAKAANALSGAIRSPSKNRANAMTLFLRALEQFRLDISYKDFKYFSFQCWQEGVARYTEFRVAELASKKFAPSTAFISLKDYKPFREVADSIHAKILNELAHPSLATSKRVAFYSFGAGEALLLDKVRPGWKKNYFRVNFHLERYLSR